MIELVSRFGFNIHRYRNVIADEPIVSNELLNFDRRIQSDFTRHQRYE